MVQSDSNFSMNSLPPQNIEAEESILGGLLQDTEAMARVVDLITIDAFYVPAHRKIYDAALQLHSQGQPTDFITVTSWLKDHHLLDEIGGMAKITQLIDHTVSAVNIDRYAALVMDKYIRRQLIKAGHEIVDIGHDTTQEMETVLDEAEQKVFRLSQKRPQEGLIPISDTIVQTFSELEKLYQKTASPGLATDFYDIDAMTGGLQRSDLIIIAGRPSMGKCLVADTEILLKNGSLVTIEEIYQRRQGQLLTLNDEWKFILTTPSNFINDGIKPVFRVTTKLGRSIDTTLTHPYLTINGWQPLSQLKIGDKIAVPRHLNIFGTDILPEYKVKLLAYFISDSCLTETFPIFTNNNPLLQQEFITSIAHFEGVKVNLKNSVTLWLKEVGIWGKDAHHKIIPPIIFKLKKSLLALFLNRLFATDGWASVLKSSQVQLGYCTVSQKMASQIQHLLLRFGIIACLKKRFIKYNNNKKIAWQLDITDSKSIKIFIDEIGIFGKESAIELVKDALVAKSYQTNCDLIPIEIWQKIQIAKGDESWRSLGKRAGLKNYSNLHIGKRSLSRNRLFQLATALDDLSLQQLATSDVYWDEIVSIEAVGMKQVYDLTIPETHNFVANDICVHNTAFGLGLGLSIARKHNLPVSIFSLEMSKEQLVLRLLASEAEIDSNRLRTGHFSQNELEPLQMAMADLSTLPIYMDDTANITVMQIRSQVRRLQSENKGNMGLVLIDYLQLMEGGGDNRVQELSKITRALKGLAREINAPVIALSQLSRAVESRNNKRPMMSDLRESGCLSGDSLVELVEPRKRVPIKELVGQSGFSVLSLNLLTMKLEKAMVTKAFCTGVKPVFCLKTRLGRTIKATANHQFLTIQGWKRLDQLTIKSFIALPRFLSSLTTSTMSNNLIPSDIWRLYAVPAMEKSGLSTRQMQKQLGNQYCGTSLYKNSLSRERAKKLGEIVQCNTIKNLAVSDVYWDQIVSIDYEGETEVFDLTVESYHNFIANNIIVHNSIEQDADLIMMLYRDEYYNPDTHDRGIAEINLVKHRNGPTGIRQLLFRPEFTKFYNMQRNNFE